MNEPTSADAPSGVARPLPPPPFLPPTTVAKPRGGSNADLARTASLARLLVDEVERAVIGKRAVLELVLCGLLADGHVLLDDLPGVAKTLMARSFATAAGLGFSRVQFTPDLLPSDVTGATVLDLVTNKAAFEPGPIFAQLVLADEINRAPAKTQSALLEAMQEHQVTVDGRTRPLPEPFIVIATQNPIESEGTFALPEAQLDRFILRTRVGYPSREDERELLARRIARRADDVEIRPVVSAADVLAMQASLEHVEVDARILQFIVDLLTATRSSRDLRVGASPRGGIALLKLSRARAVLSNRDFVTPDDVRAIAIPALAHRVVLSGEAWAREADPVALVRTAIDSVAAPSWQ